MRKPFERSKETDKLLSFFSTISVGQAVTYQEASQIVGFKVASSLPAYQSARRLAVNDKGIVIESLPGHGFVRLDAPSIVDRGGKHLRSIRRKAKHASKEMKAAISGNLDRDQMMRATEQFNRFRLIDSTAQPVRYDSNKRTIAEILPVAPIEAKAMFGEA